MCSIEWNKNFVINLMTETFGKKLRDFRVDSEIGLRELARLINKSPGYLSDVEHGHVPPPSEEVILKIADVLQADKNELLMAAKKMDPELSNFVALEPQAADFLRMAKNKGFEREDWEKLSQLVDIAKLGRSEKDTQ
jgi:transcriptional regulator with XRE-family HTH domain